jgi:hypothetical protein
MFSFNKNKSKRAELRKLIDGFQDSFSKEQKAAIIIYLLKTAKCQGTISNKEGEFIESTSAMLDFSVNDPMMTVFLKQGIAIMIDTLRDLSIAQKMWLVVSVKELLQIDGKVDDIKFKYTSTIFGHIGITDEILGKIETL